ncbi:MAG: DUF6370 family protein [Vicingaceae bacterium]|nr:DUF6370 family protein [Vicingaceae bacterium]
MKNQLLIISILLISLSVNAQSKEKTYKVLASCGSCNFEMNSETGCALAIQYGGKKYWVDGSTLQDHGDEHDPEGGMCETVRKAEIKGDFEEKRFKSSSFILLADKKKKKK